MSINLVCGKTSVLSRERSESGNEIYMIMFEDKDEKPITDNAIHGTTITELANKLKGKVTNKFYLRNYDAEPVGKPIKPLSRDEYITLLNFIAS